jgi:hypothetical protein
MLYMDDRFNMNTTVITASPQKQFGIDMALSMEHAMPNTDWFLLSTMPFCSGVYGIVRCLYTPCSEQYSVKPRVVNSPP